MNRSSTSSQPKAKARVLTPRGARTRQELLDAAEQVFGKRGFEKASIQEITRQAGVALGTFYVYFPHKEAIFIELVDELGLRLRQALGVALAGTTTRLEKERAGFRAFFEFAGKHRNLYRIVRQAEFVDEAVHHRYYRRLADSYARGLKDAMGAKEIARFDPEVLAWALMGIADFIGMRFVVWDSPAELDRISDDVVRFITTGLKPDKRHTEQS
jgi:AcrR family transcriptional regulator